MASMDSTNPALEKARKQLREVTRILANNPSAKTRPTWRKLRDQTLKLIEVLERNDKARKTT